MLMRYVGYLRRNQSGAPEPKLDFQGYNFWLTKPNQFHGNYINAEMANASIFQASIANDLDLEKYVRQVSK
jgi:hypothetical protein